MKAVFLTITIATKITARPRNVAWVVLMVVQIILALIKFELYILFFSFKSIKNDFKLFFSFMLQKNFCGLLDHKLEY